MSAPDEMPESALAADLPSLRVGWWNTGLIAPGQRPSTKSKDGLKRWNLTKEIVNELLLQADMLILGEIDGETLFSLCPGRFNSLPGAGGIKSGLGVIFDPRRVEISHQTHTRFRKRGRELRILELTLKHVNVDVNIQILGVHFPSHLREDQEALRRLFASDLSSEIQQRRQGDDDAHLVVIGDFNDEPFSDAMHGQLRGVRERRLVHGDPGRELLYNPFWRKLGEHRPTTRGAPSFSPAGTHYYGKNARNGQCWYTYDQMLVTGAFLDEAGWSLNEEHTDIVCPESLFSQTSLKYGVDHLPIIGRFSYLPEKGAPQ